MDVSKLNERQKEIINKLYNILESEDSLIAWLSIPNKMFKSRPPIDLLMSENYDYFDRLNIVKK